MVLCGYLFDAIAVSLSLPEEAAEELTDASVEVTFGDYMITFTSSRINVTEIPPDKSLEFEENTENIRTMLTSAPMTITLNVNEEPVGTGVMDWPESVLASLEQMAEVSHTENITLFSGDDSEKKTKMGNIQLMIRFKPKCKNLDDEEFGKNFEEAKDEILKEVNSKDLFFVIEDKGRLHECKNPMILPSAEMQPSRTLDMTELRNFNGLLVPTPNMLNSCCIDDCCGLKKSLKKYGPNDKIVKGTVNQMKQQKKKAKKDDRSGIKNQECMPCDSSSGSEEASTSERSEESELDVQWGGREPPKICLTTPPPELTRDVPIRPRCCPVCTTNLDWLPPYVSCPKCGYRPQPKIEQLPYNEAIDADEILNEFFLRDEPSDPINCRAAVHKDVDSEDCDCECQKGNTCAHCRVRRACRNVFGKKFDVAPECSNIPQPALYSEPLQKIFCQMKDLLDRTEHLQMEEAFDKCASMFDNKEEKQIKRNIFGDANYSPCKELQVIKEKFSRCKTNYPDCEGVKAENSNKQIAPASQAPCSCTKKKRSKKQTCRFPCGKYPPIENKCVPCHKKMIPCRMGWLWTADPHAKEGWRPGAVSRKIRHLMSFFLKGFPKDTYKIRNKCNKPPSEPKKKCPLLSIDKRNGCLTIILHPTEDETHPCYKKSHPLIFKIQLNEETQKMRAIRDELLECGYSKCVCLKPVAYCQCRDECERAKLENYLIEESCIQNIPDLEEKLILNNEYDSETEFDFCVYGDNKKQQKRKKTHNVRVPKDIC